MTKSSQSPHPVLVVWKDAHGMFGEWQDLSLPEPDVDEYLVNTVGYLLPGRKKGHTVVCLNLSDYHVADGVAIPDDMVISVTKLAPAKK